MFQESEACVTVSHLMTMGRAWIQDPKLHNSLVLGTSYVFLINTAVFVSGNVNKRAAKPLQISMLTLSMLTLSLRCDQSDDMICEREVIGVVR